jgi:hypothetical protein
MFPRAFGQNDANVKFFRIPVLSGLFRVEVRTVKHIVPAHLGPFTALSAAGGIRPDVYVGFGCGVHVASLSRPPPLAAAGWTGMRVAYSLNATAYPC